MKVGDRVEYLKGSCIPGTIIAIVNKEHEGRMLKVKWDDGRVGLEFEDTLIILHKEYSWMPDYVEFWKTHKDEDFKHVRHQSKRRISYINPGFLVRLYKR